jgi:tRNA nucleotidyltransferase (CCA-adding enzyme)
MRYRNLVTEAVEKIDSPEYRQLLTPELRKLESVFNQYGYDLRIVGGAVRDLVQGKEPKDIDLATDATPEEMIGVLDTAGIKYIATGLQHGTITAVLNGEDFEITTLRVDTEHTGRHAQVAWTRSWEKDAERRDLTFNAMSLDLEGNLYDYYGGLQDLKQGEVRFVGDAEERIREDYLRILRYFRFHSRYKDTTYPEGTEDAIAQTAEGLKQISGERIWMEVKQILIAPSGADALAKMDQLGVASVIGLPVHNTGEVRRLQPYKSSILSLAAMLSDEREARDLVERWRMSGDERDRLLFYVRYKDQRLDEQTAKNMVVDGANQSWVSRLLILQGQVGLANKIKRWDVPTFPIGGRDLQEKGVAPGPEMGKLLKRLKSEWKESGYTLTRDQLLDRV